MAGGSSYAQASSFSWICSCSFRAARERPCRRTLRQYQYLHLEGGAFADDKTGAFSHCGATSIYDNRVILMVGLNAQNSWLLGFASPSFRLTKGNTVPVDVTFDGQSQARLFAAVNTDIMATAILPPNVARTFQKSSLMVVTTGNSNALQFNLTSTGPLLAMIANCVSTVKAGGINRAGEFSAPKTVAATKPDASGNPKSGRTGTQTGTGFVVSANGHIVTNHHVIDGCTGDIKGNLTGEATTTLRVVNSDSANDLALLQGPAESFKVHTQIRDRAIHSGDSVVAIGFPYHGLLTSDFAVTTGIVSSLSGILNDTRFRQISAAVQPGNSGGPLLDTSGDIVGAVSGKLDALKIARDRQYPGKHQFRDQDRRHPRLPRQQRRALSDISARHRAQDRRHRHQRAGVHAADLVHGDGAGGDGEAVV